MASPVRREANPQLHLGSQPREHEPSRLLGNADFLGELHGRNAFARSHQEVHGIQPLMQRDVTPTEDGTRPNGEGEFLACVAAVKTFRSGNHGLTRFALWADRAVGPETIFEVRPSRFLVREKFEQLEGADCALAHSASRLSLEVVFQYLREAFEPIVHEPLVPFHHAFDVRRRPAHFFSGVSHRVTSPRNIFGTNEIHCVCHDSIVDEFPWEVKYIIPNDFTFHALQWLV